MKFKGTLGLALAFAGFALYYYLVELPTAEREQTEKEHAEKLLPLDRNTVEELTIARSGETIILKSRDKNKWDMLQPTQAKVDAAEVDALLANLESARFTRVVDENPKNLAGFGLKNPSLKITVKTAGEKTAKTLLVGDPSPIGHSFYAQREGENRVLLSPNDKSQWDKSAGQLRDKTIMDFSTQDAVEVQLQLNNKTILITKKGDDWILTDAALTAKADRSEIKNLLDAVQFAGIVSFVDENPADLAPYGLDTPTVKLTVKVGEKKDVHFLNVGKQDNAKNYFALANRGKNIFTINNPLVNTLNKNELDFLDRTLLDFKAEDVAEIRIRDGNSSVTLGRDPQAVKGKEWKILGPQAASADASTVDSLIKDVKSARLPAFVAGPGANLKSYGLEPAAEKIFTLVFADKKTAGFELGERTRDGKNRFGRRQGEAPVFVLGDEMANKLFRSAADLRYKKMLEFKSEAVAKIEIRLQDQTFELLRNGEDWSLKKPKDIAKLQGFIGKDILWTLNNLEFVRKEEKPESLRTAGLEKPLLTVGLFDKTGQSVAAVRVGARTNEPGLYYAQTGNDPALYLVRERFVDEIPKAMDRFKPQS
jgi:hypothetical protein